MKLRQVRFDDKLHAVVWSGDIEIRIPSTIITWRLEASDPSDLTQQQKSTLQKQLNRQGITLVEVNNRQIVVEVTAAQMVNKRLAGATSINIAEIVVFARKYVNDGLNLVLVDRIIG